MQLDTFAQHTHTAWDDYLTRIYAADLLGHLDSRGGTVLFPRMLICTETKGHLVAELVGASAAFEGLKVRKQRQKSIYRYISQFTDDAPDPVFTLDSARQQFSGIALSQGVDGASLQQRFPFAELHRTVLHRIGGSGSPLAFGPSFESVAFDNCLFINQHNALVRVKHALFLCIIGKSVPESEYRHFIYDDIQAGNQARAVHTVKSGHLPHDQIAAQFANLFLWPDLRETTIGEFLKGHASLLHSALGSKRVLFEPHLEWVDGPANGDTAINPDLMIENENGFFDIYDLKTAVLDRATITKGPRRRRRFIDYVEEGVAQLAHYREYFQHPGNAKRALDKYGARVRNPALVLVVGSYENVDVQAVAEATRRLDGVSILDYDTLMQLFLSRSRERSSTLLE